MGRFFVMQLKNPESFRTKLERFYVSIQLWLNMPAEELFMTIEVVFSVHQLLRHLTWKYFTVFEKVLAIIEEFEVDFHVFPNSLAIFTNWTKIRSWHTYQQH